MYILHPLVHKRRGQARCAKKVLFFETIYSFYASLLFKKDYNKKGSVSFCVFVMKWALVNKEE